MGEWTGLAARRAGCLLTPLLDGEPTERSAVSSSSGWPGNFMAATGGGSPTLLGQFSRVPTVQFVGFWYYVRATGLEYWLWTAFADYDYYLCPAGNETYAQVRVN